MQTYAIAGKAYAARSLCQALHAARATALSETTPASELCPWTNPGDGEWKLICNALGLEVYAGETVFTSNSPVRVAPGLGSPPHKPSSTGRIWVQELSNSPVREYFPSVCGCKWVYQ